MTPYLTHDLSGIGGQLKSTPEDFFVEEIPLYLPSGEGQHTYLTIEKRGLSTHEAIKRIAQALSIDRRAIGYAGLKDAQAVTQQTLSIDGISPAAVDGIDVPSVTILAAKSHRNKLKLGHLKGNRFRLRVRQVSEDALPQAERILNELAQHGIPNFFGGQRFGVRDNSHKLGEWLVRQNVAEFVADYLGRPQPQEFADVQTARALVDEGQWSAALEAWPSNMLRDERAILEQIVKDGGNLDKVWQRLPKKMKTFFFSAFQSHLFNQLLAQRLPTMHQLEVGDVAYIHAKGAAFVVEDAAVEQPRADSFEISPSGPMFGPKVLLAQGEPGQREQAVLDEYGLSLTDFKMPGLKMVGARRPYRIELKQPQVEWDDGLVVSFELPPGAYATTVMGEVMKL